MLRTTPEYAAAHLRDLAASAPQPGAAAIARRRRVERRQKLSRFAASIHRAIPFVNKAGEPEVAPSEPKPAT